jgi:hypothetical protein
MKSSIALAKPSSSLEAVTCVAATEHIIVRHQLVQADHLNLPGLLTHPDRDRHPRMVLNPCARAVLGKRGTDVARISHRSDDAPAGAVTQPDCDTARGRRPWALDVAGAPVQGSAPGWNEGQLPERAWGGTI